MATADRSEAHRAGRRGPRCKRLCATLLAALLPAFTVPPLMAQQTPASGQAATGQGVSPAGTTTPAPAAPGTNGATQGQQKQEDNGKNVLESAGGFTTLELATTTVAQLPSCLEYTIEGITLRMVIHWWGVSYFWTPHVSHYSPDLLEMSHRELQYFPYIEYRLLLAIPYYEFTRTVFSRLLATLLGFNVNVPMAGGHYLHDQFGKHQSVQFSDAMVIGHPVAMLIEAFTFKGVKLPQTNGGGGQRPQISQADVKAWLESWVTGDTNWPPVFSQALGYQEVLAMLANSPVIQQIKQLMLQIDAALSAVGGKVGDSPFCPVNSTPFEPYYLSGGDVYPWRIGYPVADSEKSLTILNPLSRDVNATSRRKPSSAKCWKKLRRHCMSCSASVGVMCIHAKARLTNETAPKSLQWWHSVRLTCSPRRRNPPDASTASRATACAASLGRRCTRSRPPATKTSLTPVPRLTVLTTCTPGRCGRSTTAICSP